MKVGGVGAVIPGVTRQGIIGNLAAVATDNPQHTFFIPGNFSVTLIARSNCLCADTTVLLVEVLDGRRFG